MRPEDARSPERGIGRPAVSTSSIVPGTRWTNSSSSASAARRSTRPGVRCTPKHSWIDADLRAPYPYLWSLPARVRDGDLGDLDGLLASDERPTWVVVARASLDDWGLDFTRAQALLDSDYDPVDTAGTFTVYRRAA